MISHLRYIQQVIEEIKKLDAEYDKLNEVFISGEVDGYGKVFLASPIDLIDLQYFCVRAKVLAEGRTSHARCNYKAASVFL